MGTSLYPQIENSDAEWTRDISGKALSKHYERLQKLTRKDGHKDLMDYFVPSAEDLEEWGVETPPEQTWFNPAEGLALIDSMFREFRKHQQEFERAELLESDLESFRRILDRAAGEGRRWNLGMSY